jgi:hypothetical protein
MRRSDREKSQTMWKGSVTKMIRRDQQEAARLRGTPSPDERFTHESRSDILRLPERKRAKRRIVGAER